MLVPLLAELVGELCTILPVTYLDAPDHFGAIIKLMSRFLHSFGLFISVFPVQVFALQTSQLFYW